MPVALLHFRTEALSTALRTLDLLAAKDILGISLPALLAGRIHPLDDKRPCVLPVFEVDNLEALAWWADLTGPLGYTSLALVTTSHLVNGLALSPSDIDLLLGHGVVIGSAGHRQRPLVGLSAIDLRDELMASASILDEIAPYDVTVLCPEPNRLGVALDGLVLREGRRAGFRLFLSPGEGIDDGDGETLTYREIGGDDHPAEVRRWVLGEGFARERAKLRRYNRLSRRLLGFAQTPSSPIPPTDR